MHTFEKAFASIAVLALVIVACTPAEPQSGRQTIAASSSVAQAEEARAQLAKARAEFVAAYDAADLDRFVAMFANDATYSGLRQTTWVKGKDEIRSMWDIALKKDPARNFEFEEPLTYLSRDNNFAVDAGYARMDMASKAGTPVDRMIKQPMRVSITWIRTDQGWRIINMVASPKTAIAPGFLRGH